MVLPGGVCRGLGEHSPHPSTLTALGALQHHLLPAGKLLFKVF